MLSCVQFLRPYGLLPDWLLCPWDFPGKTTGVPFPSSEDLPNPEIKPALQAGSLLTKAQGKPLFYFSIITSFTFLSWVKYEYDLDHKGSQRVLHGFDDRRKKEGSQEIKEECKSKERETKVYLTIYAGIQNLCLETHQSVSDTEQMAVSDLHSISVS